MKEGIQSIIKNIDSDAARHSGERLEQLNAATDREIARENEAFRAEMDQRRDMLLAHNEEELRHRLERHSRRLERALLTYRRELLDEIFDMAVRELRIISDKEYAEIFLTATRDLVGSFTLHIGEYSDGKIGPEIVEEAVRLSSGLDISISPVLIPGKSGFVIKDKRVEYDYLFEDMIEDIKSEKSALILREVFEDY